MLGAGWLVIHHKPGWYRPPTLAEEGLQRARREAVAAADDFGDQLVLRRPFEVTLTDSSVNEWLAALPSAWPEAKDWLPPELSEPAVRFTDGCLQVAAKLDRRELQTIVSFDVRPTVTEDAHAIAFTLEATRSGALRIPGWILEPWLRPALEANRPDRPGEAETNTGDALFSIPNDFVWPNGERAFRISAIEINDSQLRLTIEPR